MGYRLHFLLGNLGFAFLNGHSVDFVDVLLLVVGFEALDDLLDDCFFGVGVDPAEDDAGGPPHLQVLHVLGFLLGRHQAAQGQEGQAYPLLHILIEYYLHKTCVSHYTIYHVLTLTAGTDCPARSSWSKKGSPAIAVPCPRPASSASSLFPSYNQIYLGLVLLGYEGVSEYPDFQEQTLVFIISQFTIGFLLSAVVVGGVQFSLELGVGLPSFNDSFLHDFHFSFQLFYGLEVFLWGHIVFDSFGADHYIIERGF